MPRNSTWGVVNQTKWKVLFRKEKSIELHSDYNKVHTWVLFIYYNLIAHQVNRTLT